MKVLKILLYILLVLGVGAGLYFSYGLYKKAKDEPIDALYLIPENAAIVFTSTNYTSLKSEVLDKSEIWASLIKDNNLQMWLQEFDSLYNNIVMSIGDKPINVKSYYSIHFSGNNKFKGLLSFSFNKNLDSKEITNLLSKYGTVSSRDFEGKSIIGLKSKLLKEKVYLVFQHGNLSISNNSQLIEKLILESLNIKEAKKKNISKMLRIAGKDSKASLFINYRYLYRLISSYASKDYMNNVKQISALSSYSVLDLNSSPNHFSLNGFSFDTDSTNGRLTGYSQYDAPNIEIFNHIPSQTSFVYYQGVNKMNEYMEKQSSSDYSVEDERSIKLYKADLMIDVRDYFYPWIKNELAFCLLKEKANKNESEAFAIMNTYDSKESSQTLGKLMKIASEYKEVDIDTIDYRTYKINYIPLPYLLSNIFGDMFSPIQNTYYSIIGDYVVFASKVSVIKKYIDNILINKTLAKREGFSDFYDNISPEANVMLYANMHAFDKVFKNFVSSNTIGYLQESAMKISDFGDACIQFVSGEDGVYTAVNINKTELNEEEEAVSWQVALDHDFVNGPYVVYNHKTKKNDIIVFDNHNMMYRISNAGEIMWAIPVAELPLGKVQSIDFYKNGKYQVVYNSEKYVYMLDLNGNRVEDYPKPIIPNATAAMTIVDYDRNKNYRIIVPLADGVIHNYKSGGEETKGWKNPRMTNLVNNSVQYFKLGSKDFLLITDTAGNVVFCNRKGEARIEAKLAFTNNSKTAFYKLGNNLVTTDRLGRLISIDDKGMVQKFLLRDFSKNHYFTLIDVDNDGRKEFVFYDNNEIFIYNQKHELLWSKLLEINVENMFTPFNVLLEDSTTFMMYDMDNQQFVSAGNNGVFVAKDEFSASKNYKIYKTTNKENLRLISAKGRVVSNYLLK